MQEGKAGDREFYLGMYERLVLSLLIDSDWSDVACFSEKETLPSRISEEKNVKFGIRQFLIMIII